ELAARRISRRMPVLAEARARRGLAGVYDVSPDGKPLIGPAPSVEGLYVEVGFSGTGFKISPATGLCLAELIADGRATTVDLTPFRLTRFAEGRPFISETEYTDGLEVEGVAAWSR
ncbi:MAG TPA: FAD-binding oxidoreductase, partial [Dehalococcoidia bacterium]|nr:FAD-binding oxidoreductase [Dehalococcoidia bacterium]